MIQQITIKNFAIIDDLSLDLSSGFTVLTGETGAGKSIIIDALGLLTGDRSNNSMIRHGSDKAFIEGAFSLNEASKAFLQEILPMEEDILIVSREIDKEGRSNSRINGRLTSVSMIRKIMQHIIDIHSQNDNQYLLDHRSHLLLIDGYQEKLIQPTKNQYLELYQQYVEVSKEINKTKETQFNQEQLDFYRFQLDEIQAAKILPNELEELEIERKRISSYERISSRIQLILDALRGENGAVTSLYEAKKAIDELSDDPQFACFSDQIKEIYYQADDLAGELRSTFESLDFDPSRLTEIHDRVFLINKIKRKYGKTYEEIEETAQILRKDIDRMEHHERLCIELENKKQEIRTKLFTVGSKLSILRNDAVTALAVAVKKELTDLYLPFVEFSASFEELGEPSNTGIDQIEFLISTNPGQPLRPLTKVASGGEVSRLMLGLKSVFSRLSGVETIIFDEVDAGVSGEIAYAVGKKMKQLSASCQVLCISHLPQVSALGDHHYRVSKLIQDNITSTVVTVLSQSDRVLEIARMLSNNPVPSDITIKMAKELLKK